MSSDAQYERDSNLATRIAFHETYTNPYVDFAEWILRHLPLSAGMRVLELGCGNGEFWVRNAAKLPTDLELVLTDKSAGMVEQAERRLEDAGIAASFRTMAAEEIDPTSGKFDLILANHMLYHVADRPLALSNAASVLEAGGWFCASTNSSTYMQQLESLITAEGVNWYVDFSGEFALENGVDQLSPWFAQIETDVLDGRLVVPEAEAVLTYVKSTASMFPESEALMAACENMRPEIQSVIDCEGAFTISKRAGLFRCQ